MSWFDLASARYFVTRVPPELTPLHMNTAPVADEQGCANATQDRALFCAVVPSRTLQYITDAARDSRSRDSCNNDSRIAEATLFIEACAIEYGDRNTSSASGSAYVSAYVSAYAEDCTKIPFFQWIRRGVRADGCSARNTLRIIWDSLYTARVQPLCMCFLLHWDPVWRRAFINTQGALAEQCTIYESELQGHREIVPYLVASARCALRATCTYFTQTGLTSHPARIQLLLCHIMPEAAFIRRCFHIAVSASQQRKMDDAECLGSQGLSVKEANELL